MALEKSIKKVAQNHKKEQPYLFDELWATDSSKKSKNKKNGGYEVGRLMISDLVDIKRLALGLQSKNGKILNSDERTALVAGLTSSKDIIEYNELRNVHDYLVRTSILSELYSQNASMEALKLINALLNLQRSEIENKYLFNQLGEKSKVLKHLKKHYPMAEEILEDSCLYKKFYSEYKLNLQELFILKESVKMVGMKLEIEDLDLIIAQPNQEYHDILNELMITVPPLIYRWGRYDNEGNQITLKNELKKIFKPLELKDLKPDIFLTEKAKKQFTLKLVQGNEQILYDMLRNS